MPLGLWMEEGFTALSAQAGVEMSVLTSAHVPLRVGLGGRVPIPAHPQKPPKRAAPVSGPTELSWGREPTGPPEERSRGK